MGTRSRIFWLGLLGTVFFWWWSGRPISHPPGVLVPGEPWQSTEQLDKRAITLGNWSLVPLARYDIEARVLSKSRYRLNEAAQLAPWDFALGWGVMSDSAILDELSITQESRWFLWRTSGELPAPVDEMQNHSANVHIIPSNENVRDQLDSVRTGQIVRLIGNLVEATSSGSGGRWRSSLSRSDTGAGACEVMYVQSCVTRD